MGRYLESIFGNGTWLVIGASFPNNHTTVQAASNITALIIGIVIGWLLSKYYDKKD